MAGLPFGFGLFDTVLPGRNEIPPDVPRAIHGCATDDDKMRIGACRDPHRIARCEYEQTAGLEFVARNVDSSVNDVDGALLVTCIERHRSACLELHIAEYGLMHRRHWRARAVKRADNDTYRLAVVLDDREFSGLVMCEACLHFFFCLRQRDPHLQP